MYKDPIDNPAWKELQELAKNKFDISELFEIEKERDLKMRLKIKEGPVDIEFDFSKNLIDEKVLEKLYKLYEEAEVKTWIEKMFTGEIVNLSEKRQVLHMALRSPKGIKYITTGSENKQNLEPMIHHELEKMKKITEMIHSGEWKGYNGKSISNIINIGIGGSDLGPKFISEALKPFSIKIDALNGKPLNVYYISNVDGYDLQKTLETCDPAQTLFIIVSKTFTTIETMMNAESAKKWFIENTKSNQIDKHFVAVSTNIEKVQEFGIPNDSSHIFKFWDWVGGRYSVWSTVGLSICIQLGFKNFSELLEGAHIVDKHFRSQKVSKNIPATMALIGIWYNNFLNFQTYGILPYEKSLKYLPSYLQQLDMESNGKSVTRNGKKIESRWQTGPIVWGEPGTDGQHSFYQLIHQGTKIIPCDFICGLTHLKAEKCSIDRNNHQKVLFSNFIAQTEALLEGTKKNLNIETVRQFEGNRPTNSIIYSTLTPANLGAIIAMYEQKIFVQGIIWNINSFDQFGVELGKKLALGVLSVINGEEKNPKYTKSTLRNINAYLGLTKN